MLKVAILGANGFIGSRAVEIFHLEGLAEVRPVVRSAAGLARLSRFDLDCCIANAFDQSALQVAFAGCDIVLYAVAGDPKTIVGTVAPTYRAAQEAGVRRLVYLSTASVHGQNPQLGTDENSPLNDRQLLPYNNAKVQAEWKLLKLRKEGSVELVMLRPGIVFGPRSYWTGSFADNLLTGKAYLINQGKGICNCIYVDNLIQAIYLAMTVPPVDREVFLVGDQERITWVDFYQPIVKALGIDLAHVPRVTIPEFTSTRYNLETIHTSRYMQTVLFFFPDKLKRAVKAAISAWKEPPISPWALPTQQELAVTLEMALLYQCQYKFPFEKATKLLGYKPAIPFSEGCRRSIAWLAFAGYPVVDECRPR